MLSTSIPHKGTKL